MHYHGVCAHGLILHSHFSGSWELAFTRFTRSFLLFRLVHFRHSSAVFTLVFRTGFLDFFFRFSCVPYAQGLDSSLFCIYILRTGSRTFLALHVHSAHTVLVFPWFHICTLYALGFGLSLFCIYFLRSGWVFDFSLLCLCILQTVLDFSLFRMRTLRTGS